MGVELSDFIAFDLADVFDCELDFNLRVRIDLSELSLRSLY